MTGVRAFPVIPYGNASFGMAFDPSVRLVFTVSGDRTTKVSLHQGGDTITGDRKQPAPHPRHMSDDTRKVGTGLGARVVAQDWAGVHALLAP